MRDVLQHFDLIEKAIEYSAALEAEIAVKRRSALRGTISGVVYFADGSRLEFAERVIIHLHRLLKQSYRYQFVQAGAAVFRYDNAPHHEHVSTHPHHKHIGDHSVPALEPEFKQVLAEAVALLQPTPSRNGKRRRTSKP